MGSSREVAVAALAEPTVIIAVFALALRAGTIDLGRVVERFGSEPWLAANPAHLLAFAALFIVMLAETGRLPVDNPATHLELTMIHEAMVLEYSGRYLALVEWASAMKLFVFMTLLANLFVPWGLAEPTGLVPVLLGVTALAAKLAVLTAAVALLETAVAKLRLFRVPELLALTRQARRCGWPCSPSRPPASRSDWDRPSWCRRSDRSPLPCCERRCRRPAGTG
jgi:formate hydrogenlyase subunit 4